MSECSKYLYYRRLPKDLVEICVFVCAVSLMGDSTVRQLLSPLQWQSYYIIRVSRGRGSKVAMCKVGKFGRFVGEAEPGEDRSLSRVKCH